MAQEEHRAARRRCRSAVAVLELKPTSLLRRSPRYMLPRACDRSKLPCTQGARGQRISGSMQSPERAFPKSPRTVAAPGLAAVDKLSFLPPRFVRISGPTGPRSSAMNHKGPWSGVHGHAGVVFEQSRKRSQLVHRRDEGYRLRKRAATDQIQSEAKI